jgi:hypothetical protein
MADGYLRPKVGAPNLERKKKNGMFINPPSYAEMGGFTNSGKLERGEKSKMSLERGGPKSKLGKPI